MTLILAHGTLGWADELIFLGVVVVFVAMMGISWVRSRNVKPSFDEPEKEKHDSSTDAASTAQDHFTLE